MDDITKSREIKMPQKKTIGQRVRAARKAAGIPQPQLAAEIGLSQCRMSDLENDKRPSMERELGLLAAIAAACDTDLVTLGWPERAT